MSDNVTQLHQPRRGDVSFMMCPCKGGDGTPFEVIALVQEPPVIVTLVCPECEQTIPVTNGCVGVGDA